jgi:biopolymer transport protein ExbD
MSGISRHQSEGNLGFQIAPMLDIMFVILVFFMTLAGDKKVETQLKMTLPTELGVIPTNDTPMEESISVDETGTICHNEEPVTGEELKDTFRSLKNQSKAEGNTPILVTITTTPETQWEKVATVMNAMQAAAITNVSFSVAEEL